MIIGAHVSAAGGAWNAPGNAAELELETFQIFSRPPQGGPAPKIGEEEVYKFRQAMADNGFKNFVIHAPYFTNLGSVNKRIYHGTISVLRQELERGSILGADYVMFHPGSFKDLGQEKGMKQVISGISETLKNYKGSTQLLIEISAGAGAICGDTFEELAELLFGNEKYLGKTLGGICFDTQHAFAAGYDLRTQESIKRVFADFNKRIGFEYLKMIHTNDSKVELGRCQDRHEHIDDGHIGKKGFAALASYLKSKKINVPWVLETKRDKVAQDVKILKQIKSEVWI